MNTLISILAWGLATFFLIGLIGGPRLIGKKREPLTLGGYIFNLIVSGITIALLVTLVVTL